VEAWRAASTGGTRRMDSVANNMKETGMLQDCIYKALRESDHRFLRKATTMYIKREEVKGMVIIRAQAATTDLEVRSFMLGLRQYTSHAIDINEVVDELLDAYAGEDAQLNQHMRSILEAVCVDASPEAKSARMMQKFPRAALLHPISRLSSVTGHMLPGG